MIVLILTTFNVELNADEYKYSDKPHKFIEQIVSKYPNELYIVKNLQIILFDIYHLIQSRP